MTESFLDYHPRLGVPLQIAQVPRVSKEAVYAIDFERPVNQSDTQAVREFVARQAGFAAVSTDPRFPTRMFVTCATPDTNYALLAWLQQSFKPFRPYTGIAKVYTMLRPLIAVIRLIGTLPPGYGPLTEAFMAQSDIPVARHRPGAPEIIVVFRSQPGEADIDEVAGVLTAQRLVSLTITMSQEPLPDFAALPENE